MTPGLAFGVLLTGAPLVVVVLVAEPWGAVLLLAASGIGKAFVDVAGRTLLQRTVADDVLTRVFGLQEGVSTVGNAAGSLAAPLAVAGVGVTSSFVLTGVVLPFLALLLWRWIAPLDVRAILPGPDFALVRSSPLFAPLSLPTLERLANNFQSREVASGTAVITEGEAGDRFYLIAEGRVLVTRKGRELASLGPGDGFGEIALLRDVPRTATVTTLEPTRLLTLERDEFLTAVTGTSGSVHAADAMVDERRRAHDD
jgi:hypothetical protein